METSCCRRRERRKGKKEEDTELEGVPKEEKDTRNIAASQDERSIHNYLVTMGGKKTTEGEGKEQEQMQQT